MSILKLVFAAESLRHADEDGREENGRYAE